MRADAIWGRPLAEIAAAVRSGEIDAHELSEESRRRIDADEDRVRAWVQRTPAPASEGLPANLAELPLAGIPLGVKDIIDVAGLPTRCGSPLTPAEPRAESARCVQRLTDLGCVVQGKTVTTEFAYFAPGPTRNPVDPRHTPGGSSSGSAAAVAAGMVPLALGSQTAGSLTRPAAYCGVAGMTLAHGSVDLTGITGLSGSLDSLGLLARTVEDLAYAWRAFTGQDPAERGGRVLIWRGSELDTIEPAMAQALAATIDVLTREGEVCELDWDDHVRTLASDHPVIMAYEAVRERAELRDQLDRVSAPLADLLKSGAALDEEDYEGACYRRDRSRTEFAELLGPGDVIVGPAALGPAPQGLAATGSPILSRPWQALGEPVVTVPGIRSAAGLPLGIQVIGRAGGEADLFRIAGWLAERLGDLRTPS